MRWRRMLQDSSCIVGDFIPWSLILAQDKRRHLTVAPLWRSECDNGSCRRDYRGASWETRKSLDGNPKSPNRTLLGIFVSVKALYDLRFLAEMPIRTGQRSSLTQSLDREVGCAGNVATKYSNRYRYTKSSTNSLTSRQSVRMAERGSLHRQYTIASRIQIRA